jgi:hypothetical protein
MFQADLDDDESANAYTFFALPPPFLSSRAR